MNARIWIQQAKANLSVLIKDVGTGLLEFSHNSLALVGLAVVTAGVFFSGEAQLRTKAETLVLGWLQDRHEERAEQEGNLLASLHEPGAVRRATAADPSELTREQAAVANWLSKRYRVAVEPVSRLVQEAWTLGPRAQIEPSLIMAVVAIESSFNPFAQSPMGAQGLMQVMTRVHDDKYRVFGGTLAAFDPVSNLRVGVQILRDCATRFGGVTHGLRCYVGATHPEVTDNGYVQKVLAEQKVIKDVAAGKVVPFNILLNPPTAPAATSPAAGPSAAASPPATAKPVASLAREVADPAPAASPTTVAMAAGR